MIIHADKPQLTLYPLELLLSLGHTHHTNCRAGFTTIKLAVLCLKPGAWHL